MDRREWGFVAVLLLVYVSVSAINVTKPFLRHNESSGTEFSKLARNFHKFGYLALRLGPLDLAGPRLEDHGEWRKLYMTNRNILPTLYLSAALRVFGFHEWVYRVSVILVSAFSLVLFAFVARRVLGKGWPASAAVACFGLSPMFLFYGQVALQYACSLLMIQALLLAYWRWREQRTRGRLALFYLLLFVGCNAGWPVYYAGLLIGLYEVFLEREWRSPLAWTPVVCVGIFGIHLLHLHWMNPGLLGALASDAGDRIGAGSFSLLAYVVGEARDVVIYHTGVVGLLALAWAVAAIFSRERSDRIILGLLVLGAEEVLFRSWSMQHDYFTFPLQLFFALAAARALQRLQGRRLWILGTAAAAFFAVQSAYITHRRVTTFGGYEFYYRLGRAMAEMTRPEDKILIVSVDSRLYTPFYADRYVTNYDASRKRLMTEHRAACIPAPDEESVLKWMDDHRDRCDFIVGTTKLLTHANDHFLAGASDEILRDFQVDVGDSRIHAELDRRAAEGKATRVEHGGFIFWRLTGAR